jgi:protein-S-isoprenylcysteine O-methyltransferase Ste14
LSAADLLDSQVLILVGTWLFYFLIHSLLASFRVKRLIAGYWPGLMPAYRLAFNLIALLLLLPPLYLTYQLDGPWLWRWSGPAGWLADALALISIALFYWTLKYYNSGEFIGLKQWRERTESVEDQECFHLSPLHRFVRHPWYLIGLVLIWSRDMNLAFLVTAIAITLYFWLGSRLEERKLMAYHGAIYRRYRERVPGLLPLPWRYLSREEAEELVRDANKR